MSIERLDIPLPRGNQPHRRVDDPFATILALELDRYVCLAGVNRAPDQVCLIGQEGGCPWGLVLTEYQCCAWAFIRQHPDGADPKLLAESMGFSKERLRAYTASAVRKLTERFPALGRAWAARL